MNKSPQFVFCDDRKIGRLIESDEGTIAFQYDASWIASGFEISHSLPFRVEVYQKEAQNYFANLLPEAGVRLAVARQLGISSENDYALITALGGECAGALTVGAEPLSLECKYVPVDLRDLRRRFENGETLLSSFQDEDEVRFSLAGAQDKMAVHFDGEKLFLPQGNSPSTWILKPPSRRFPHVPENECLMGWLAAQMGLDVARPQILDVAGIRACLIKRYDRTSVQEQWRRLHQEDFCQALGFSYKLKYEKDGGPSFSKVYAALEAGSERLPEDLERLVRWLIFNVVIGNCDAHAKNISLLRSPKGDWSLSPHYDFVSTRAYPKVSKNLAMMVGGSADSGTITGTHWKRLAAEIKFGASLMIKLVREFAETAPDKFESVSKEFISCYGESALIPIVKKIIQNQSRRLLSQIDK